MYWTRPVRACGRTFTALSVAIILTTTLLPSTQAAVRIWSGLGANALWNTAANWGGTVPANDDDLVFPAGASRLVNTNNLVGRRFASITFSGAGGGYVIRGNGITNTAGISGQHTAGINAFDLPVTLSGGPQTFTILAGGTLTLASNINLSGNDLTLSVLGSMTLSGAITGTGNLTKNDSGTLRLSGPLSNDYIGTTTVNAGLLELAKAGMPFATAIPGDLIIGDGISSATVRNLVFLEIADTSDVTVNRLGTLDLNNFNEAIASLTIAGGTVTTGTGTLTNGNITALASSTIATINGNLSLGTATRTIDVASGPLGTDMRISAVISGAPGVGLTKTGGGTLALNGANTYSGLTTVSSAFLELEDNLALGSAASGTVINGTGSIFVDGASVVGEGLTNNNAGAQLQSVGVAGWSGPIVLNQDIVIPTFGGSTFTISGVISGPGGITKNQTGTLVLSGANGNNFVGGMNVDEGVLELNKASGNAVPSGLVIGDGTGAAGVDLVRYLDSAQVDSSVIINDSGRLDLNGNLETIQNLTLNGGEVVTGLGTLTFTGNIIATSTADNNALISGNLNLGSVVRTFTINQGPFSPDLQVNAVVIGTGGIRKMGAGEMSLSGANTYSGVTTLGEGFLDVDDSSALGTTAGGTVVSNGATLALRFDTHVGLESLTLDGNGPSGFGALDSSFGSNSWAGNITLAGNVLITVDAGDFLNLSGAITTAVGADVTKADTGTLIYSGGAGTANSYDETFVNEGTLVLAKTIGDAAIPGDLRIGDGAGGGSSDVVRLMAASEIVNSARVTILGSGLFDLNDRFEAVGTIEGNGRVDLGSAGTSTLRQGESGDSSIFTGSISGVGAVQKFGVGMWTLTGNNTYIGNTTVSGGELRVNGSQPQSPVSVSSIATLSGDGVVGHVLVDGNLQPGASPAILTTSNLAFTVNGDFFVELNNLSPGSGHDQVNARGTVTLNNATLHLTVGSSFAPANNQRFTIITNDGADAVVGTFAGLPNGSLVSAGGLQFRVLYNGGDGNDVQLAVTNVPLRVNIIFAPLGGNGNFTFDPNECNTAIGVTVTNTTGAAVTGISATLVSRSSGVAITQPFSPYADVPAGGSGTNLVFFQISTLPGYLCGTNIDVDLILQTASHGSFRLPFFYFNNGLMGPGVRFDNSTATAIPDLGTLNSTVSVSGIDTPIRRVVVSLHITHTAADDLDISLIGPGGTTVVLSSDNGGTSSDYGTGCADVQRTQFDMSAATSITTASAPFVGTFVPEGSLLNFFGDIGTDVNGTWTLRVTDDTGGAIGTLRCWSLFLSPTVCTDGGGACESCPERVIFGSIGPRSLQQERRLTREVAPSFCGVARACPGPFSSGLRHYDAFTFVNGESNACITVSLTAECDLFSAAYTNSFNPTNLCENYLADMGDSTSLGGTNYSFNVAARATFVVVVNQVETTDFCNYRLAVSGGSCRPVLDIVPIAGNRVALDWSTAAIGYLLERTNVLSNASLPAWVPASPAAVITGSRFHVTNNASGAANFYRLRKP